MKNINSKLVFIQSILVAFFADIRCINWGLTKGGFVGDGVMSLLYIAVVGLLILTVTCSQRNIGINFRSYSIFLPIYLLLFYLLTYLLIAAPVVSIPYFLIFTITAFLIPHIAKVNVKVMLKAMIILPFFSIFRLQQIFASSVDWTTRLPMDVSYGYLIPIVANIVFLRFYYRDEKINSKFLMLLFSAINFIFFLNILLFGSRGPLVCVLLLLCFLWCLKINSNKQFVISKNKIYFIAISVVISIVFINPILTYVDSTLNRYGVEIDAISKMIHLRDVDGDISNGRSSLNTITWRGILEHPILGNGMDQYDNKNPGEDYPHNFILQILYDGGILLFVLLSPIFIKIPRYLKKCTKHEMAVFFVFFSGSVPGALFSQDLWCIPVLWLFFGLMCTKGFVVKP